MKRGVLMSAVVSVVLVLGAGAVALAATVNCTAGTECIGTRNADTMNGTSGADEMSGRAGTDTMRGNAGTDEMEGGLGADRVSAGLGDDNDFVWGGEQVGVTAPFTYPDKSNDIASGDRGSDVVYGGFGQGGVDQVFGNEGNDLIVVAQRGFPSDTGDVKVTKEIVACGNGEDTVYRDRGLDVIAENCENRISGFPDMVSAARGGSPKTTGPLGAVSAGR